MGDNVNEELYMLFMDKSIDMFVLFDNTGRIRHMNRCAKENVEIEDISDISAFDIFRGVMERDVSVNIPEKFFSDDNEGINVYRKNNTCFDVDGRFYRVGDKIVFIGYDATKLVVLEREKTKAYEDAMEASKMKSEFVANVTHELRTPVNGISGNARELESMEDDKQKLRLLSLIQQGCANMNSIINNILDFSKFESGKLVLERREFEFRNMIDFVKSNHNNKLTEKGLDFIVNISPEIPTRIIGDELRIGQVLNNLLSNATKFTSVGRVMMDAVVTTRIENKMELFFIVSDTGIGISKANQDKLFQSFTQVDASISRNYGGTGLGLNISKQLVEAMGGNIRVQSEEGKGSVFSFNIWVEADESEKQGYLKSTDADELLMKVMNLANNENTESVWVYGEKENLEEIQKKLSKLVLCIEMENWEKAEMFMDTIRKLTEAAPKEVKTTILKLKMAVQKEDYDKASAFAATLKEIVNE